MDRKLIDLYKTLYPKGTRIELIKMGNDEPNPIPNGTRGTVRYVDDMGTIHCFWDNDRTLGLVPDVDIFTKVWEGR